MRFNYELKIRENCANLLTFRFNGLRNGLSNNNKLVSALNILFHIMKESMNNQLLFSEHNTISS